MRADNGVCYSVMDQTELVVEARHLKQRMRMLIKDPFDIRALALETHRQLLNRYTSVIMTLCNQYDEPEWFQEVM